MTKAFGMGGPAGVMSGLVGAGFRGRPDSLKNAELSWLMKTTYISQDSDVLKKAPAMSQGRSVGGGGGAGRKVDTPARPAVRERDRAANGRVDDTEEDGRGGGEEGEEQELEEMFRVEEERQAQMRAIEASFEAAKKRPVHFKNKALVPVKVIPILPDFEMWPLKYVLAHFDLDPSDDVESLSKLNQQQRLVIHSFESVSHATC